MRAGGYRAALGGCQGRLSFPAQVGNQLGPSLRGGEIVQPSLTEQEHALRAHDVLLRERAHLAVGGVPERGIDLQVEGMNWNSPEAPEPRFTALGL